MFTAFESPMSPRRQILPRKSGAIGIVCARPRIIPSRDSFCAAIVDRSTLPKCLLVESLATPRPTEFRGRRWGEFSVPTLEDVILLLFWLAAKLRTSKPDGKLICRGTRFRQKEGKHRDRHAG